MRFYMVWDKEAEAYWRGRTQGLWSRNLERVYLKQNQATSAISQAHGVKKGHPKYDEVWSRYEVRLFETNDYQII